MADMLTIKSSVNGFVQEVDQQTYDALVKGGWKGRIEKTTPAAKTAKTPEEVADKKK